MTPRPPIAAPNSAMCGWAKCVASASSLCQRSKMRTRPRRTGRASSGRCRSRPRLPTRASAARPPRAAWRGSPAARSSVPAMISIRSSPFVLGRALVSPQTFGDALFDGRSKSAASCGRTSFRVPGENDTDDRQRPAALRGAHVPGARRPRDRAARSRHQLGRARDRHGAEGRVAQRGLVPGQRRDRREGRRADPDLSAHARAADAGRAVGAGAHRHPRRHGARPAPRRLDRPHDPRDRGRDERGRLPARPDRARHRRRARPARGRTTSRRARATSSWSKRAASSSSAR